MAIIKKIKSETLSVVNPIDGVYTAVFRSLEKKYAYRPGQYLHLALDEYNPSLPWPDSRCFSIQSPPSDEDIRITFSVKGSFTKRMEKELKTGKTVFLKMPYGDFLSRPLPKEKSVFIAGGTGITPFLSLFNHHSFAEYRDPVLYLGVKSAQHNIFSGELDAAARINKNLTVSILHEDLDGMLDIERIHSRQGEGSIYYISGPPTMIRSFKEYLQANSVPPDTIVTDDWE